LRSETEAIIITALASVVASSGFWQWIISKRERANSKQDSTDALTSLIMGLASIKGQELGFSYIRRGYITADELEDLQKYIYDPYRELGGNGVLERLMEEVLKLPLYEEPVRKERT